MIVTHNNFKIGDLVVLEKVQFKSPFVAVGELKNEACFLHVLDGDASFFSGNQKLALSPSDSLVLKCGHYINKWTRQPKGQLNEAVLVHFHPEVLQWAYGGEYPAFLHSDQKANYMAAKVEVTQVITTYVESLMFYFQHPDLVSEELLRLKVKELLLLLYQTTDARQIHLLLADLFTPIKFDISDVIAKHVVEDLSITDYANMLGMSLSSFKRQFTKLFGTSPRQYITQKRLELAQQKLLKNDLRISQVAYDVGFSDVSYFTKCFVKHVGVSPSVFRLQKGELIHQ